MGIPVKVRVEVNGEKFSRYINGVMENPQQTFNITGAEPVKGTNGLVSVTPAESADIRWTEPHGTVHTEHIFKGSPIAVDEKFVVSL